MRTTVTADLLDCFCAVAKSLSFNRAAAELSVSVSVVSGNVKRFEQELDFPLFHRTTRHVSLTQEGAALLPYAREVLAARRAFEDAAVRVQSGSVGRLLVADWPVLQPLVEPILHDFLQVFPDIEPKSISLLPREIPDSVLDGRVDIGLAVRPRPGLDDNHSHPPYPTDCSLGCTLLCTAPLDTLLVPRGHPLESLPAVTVHDLSDEHLLVPDPAFHNDVHLGLLHFFAQHRLEQRFRHWDVGSHFELVTLVANGRGIALICNGLRFDDREPVRLVHVSGPVPVIDVVVLSRPDPRPIVSNFTAFLEPRPTRV